MSCVLAGKQFHRLRSYRGHKQASIGFRVLKCPQGLANPGVKNGERSSSKDELLRIGSIRNSKASFLPISKAVALPCGPSQSLAWTEARHASAVLACETTG